MSKRRSPTGKRVANKARKLARKLGIYYTPPRVVRFVSRPVDPATGTGAFLFTDPPFCEATKEAANNG